MKELGDRHEIFKREDGKHDANRFVIVELTGFEFDQVTKMLESRNLSAEEQQKEQWQKDFHAYIEVLDMSTRARYALLRAGRWSDMWDEFGKFNTFDEWVAEVLKAYKLHGKKGRYYSPLHYVRNFGEVSYLELVTALEAA